MIPETIIEAADSAVAADAPCSAVRDLMLAVEYMRGVCEHAEGKNVRERKLLSRAMSVGTRINARYAHLLAGYQQHGSYWEEVAAMPFAVGLPNDLSPAADRARLSNENQTGRFARSAGTPC